jgi:Zn-dependent protease
MALLLGILIFMALFHPKMLSTGAAVLGPNYIDAYGWMSALGIFLQVVIHELATIVVAWRLKLPVQLRLFGFGANATAILENLPRRVWMDAVVGFAGPLTGTAVALALHGIYEFTKFQDAEMHVGNPFFLGMACVGYFYNLFTLIPILDLEGGWLAPAIAPQAWLLGLVATGLELTKAFNLVLLGVVSFAVPRFILLLRARAPRTDLACTTPQRVAVSVGYFVLVIGLAMVGSKTFEVLPGLVRASMGD